jgi:hypothetical protein
VGTIWTSLTSVRLNSAAKIADALVFSCEFERLEASFDSINAVASTAACIAAFAELPRL